MANNTQAPVVDTLTHYEKLTEEDIDLFNNSRALRDYMSRWDGPLFFNALGDLSDRDVLEIGVGTGRIAKAVLERGCKNLTGIDISPKTIKLAKSDLSGYSNTELIVADCESFVRNESFDVVYSVLTFMHIERKQRALTNIVTSLRLGGHLVLSIDDAKEWFDFGIRRIRLYAAPPEDYVAWLRALGCDVEAPTDLIDTFISPDGEKLETYGRRIATLLRATKQERVRPSTR